MKMVAIRISCIFALATVFQFVQTNSANAQVLNADQVRKSIERGVDYLLSRQDAKTGRWRGGLESRFPGGVTGLSTLALLNAGVEPNHPKVAKAIESLIAVPQDRLMNYVCALRLMVLTTADPKGKLYSREINRDVNWLIERQVIRGNNLGGWYYPLGRSNGADGSNSQFALLALHEAKRAGADIPRVVWERAVQYWARSQGADRQRRGRSFGGFSYTASSGGGNAATLSMTCAGISSLIIAHENLADADDFIRNGNVVCCKPLDDLQMIEDGIQWLSNKFQASRNDFYYLYSLERAGRLSGRRFFGPHDWYRAGAQRLLKLQKSGGEWKGRMHSENDPVVATSFALLFLAKGKRPIAIGKFKFGVANDWNRHPQGVHYLTRELENQWKQKLNWQTIDGNDATVADLMETPVLFISGRDQLDLTDAQKRTLKEYVESGNFIFAEANQGNSCGNNVAFDRKFRALMTEIFPDTPLEPLSKTHPIWNSHFGIVPDPEWPIFGLQACCRTSVVYVPRSLSGHWQLNRSALLDQIAARPKEQISYATELGVNVISYATGRQLRDKLDLPNYDENTVSVLTNRALVLPKLNHRGGSDDAPNAWRNVLRRANEIGLTAEMDKKLIDADPDQLFDHPFVFLHGRSRLQFTEKERKSLSQFLAGGNRGFLFADSICTSKQFTKDFKYEMERVLPSVELKPIAADHPMFTSKYGGFNIDTVTITKPNRNVDGGFERRQVKPQFLGMEINDRLVVVFSPFDLSCALENATVSHCEGYTRQDAIRLALNVLLYRLHGD